MLHRLPDDTAGRFQVLREFLLQWHGLDTGTTTGRTVDRVGKAEARIKQTLPLAVREWIVLLDDLDRIGGWERVLRDCWGLKEVPNCPALALLTSGENDRHWGPMLRDLDKEDPPTHVFVPDYERSESRFKHSGQVAPRVSTWAIEFIVSHLHLSVSVQSEREAAKPAVDWLREQTVIPVFASRIGETEVIEFEGGLIHAERDGKSSYQLRCYAPWQGDTDGDDYYLAEDALIERLDEMLGDRES
jgi:hypothetical protein